MCCWGHRRRTCNHVSAFVELHMGHVFDGNRMFPKKSCFLACPIYWPVRNLSMLVIWESVIAGLFQKSLEDSAWMSGLEVHLFMLGKFCARIVRFVSRSCLARYVARHLTGPLSGL